MSFFVTQIESPGSERFAALANEKLAVVVLMFELQSLFGAFEVRCNMFFHVSLSIELLAADVTAKRLFSSVNALVTSQVCIGLEGRWTKAALFHLFLD